jgi:hypothetical protein
LETPSENLHPNEPLTDAELDRLGDFLKSCKGGKAMNVEALDGFFAVLIAGPETVMPSEYYREVFGGEMSDACEFGSTAISTPSRILTYRDVDLRIPAAVIFSGKLGPRAGHAHDQQNSQKGGLSTMNPFRDSLQSMWGIKMLLHCSLQRFVMGDATRSERG